MLTKHRVALLLALLCGCGTESSHNPYPNNPFISNSHGLPRDSTTSYFRKADAIPASFVPPEKRGAEVPVAQEKTCAFELSAASICLHYFQAPVLSNYYTGVETYRFLWLRSFHRPVLITVQRTALTVLLRTQQLSKFPGYTDHTPLSPNEPGISDQDRARRMRMLAFAATDTGLPRRIREGKARSVILTNAETIRPITNQQWQRIQLLLKQAHIWQLPACPSNQPLLTDGSNWLLEAHTPSRYKVVHRRSPDEADGFRRCCEYLIDLSSVNNAERY